MADRTKRDLEEITARILAEMGRRFDETDTLLDRMAKRAASLTDTMARLVDQARRLEALQQGRQG